MTDSSASPSPLRRVAIAGASGRMGHMLIEAIRASEDCRLAGALDIASSPAIGTDAAAFLGAASGVPIVSDLRAGLADAQVLIDFTRPEGTLAHLAACRELGVQMVIGTTGFSDAQKEQIAIQQLVPGPWPVSVIVCAVAALAGTWAVATLRR